jgi:hypothetical protein
MLRGANVRHLTSPPNAVPKGLNINVTHAAQLFGSAFVVVMTARTAVALAMCISKISIHVA